MKPKIGVCYYPEHWDEAMWPEDARRMRETGITWVRIGEFAWSRLEPSEGRFDWQWLDRSVEVLASEGLKIVMGTPSATPPRWVVEKYPDMLAVNKKGQARKFGSRRHYCFSHLGYRLEAARMAAAMARRYGAHHAIQAWQIDNEYGCHDTTISFSNAARDGFRNWLAQKYQSPAALNKAWGNVFWSMEYDEFEDVDLPNLTVTEANPGHWLDFRRYTSDQVVEFNKAQVAAIRAHTDAPLIHNYMGRITDFDHFHVGQDLDIASWDSYPMGFLEQFLPEENEEWKRQFAQQGDPDFQAFHHDLYRSVGKGRWWVMEQQPGPVNWAPYNPIPLDGMVKFWGMEAFAHGAEVVSYFRWRQAPFAQEQMHAGLLRPDGQNAPAQAEVVQLAHEIEALGEIEQRQAKVAIIFDYTSQWAWEIQPQGKGFDYFRLVFEQYRSLRRLGLNIDILPSTCSDFGGYEMVLIPGLMAWTPELRAAIRAFGGLVIAGPRTGQKTQALQIPSSLGPDFMDLTVARVASLRPNMQLPLERGGEVCHWLEEIEGGEAVEKTTSGAKVVLRENQQIYFAAWFDAAGYDRIFTDICTQSGIEILPMPEGVRQRQRGSQKLVMNYNPSAIEFYGHILPAGGYSWM